jgi:ribosome biogenesis GTPase
LEIKLKIRYPKNLDYDSEKIKKISKRKRSNKGRSFDDWLISYRAKNNQLSKILKKYFALGLRLGRVIEVQKRNVFVAEEQIDGTIDIESLWFCSVSKRHFQRSHVERNFVVVGDRILYMPDKDEVLDENGVPTQSELPRAVIQYLIERENQLARKDLINKNWEHVLFANIDVILIMASILNPKVRWGLIDRILVQAEYENIEAVIVLNKWDLLDESNQDFKNSLENHVSLYQKIGYRVFKISALKRKKYPTEIKKLKDYLRKKIFAICGHSGVGKSSFLNLLEPEFELPVDENPDIFYKGRHTTTYNSLLSLGIDSFAIDSPGVRSFSIPSKSSIELSHCFKEFRAFSCKYRECSHDDEPDCGIKKALEQGLISESRYRSFIGILKNRSFREGEFDDEDHEMIADLNARKQNQESSDNME